MRCFDNFATPLYSLVLMFAESYRGSDMCMKLQPRLKEKTWVGFSPLALFLFLCWPVASLGQGIDHEIGVVDRTIRFFDPVGQSFVAPAPIIDSIRVGFSVANDFAPNDSLVTVLHEGSGLDGPIVASGSIELPLDLPESSDPPGDLVDLGLGMISLQEGQIYTFAISAPTDSSRNAVIYSGESFGDTYPDGEMFHGPDAFSPPDLADDIRFRITAPLFFDSFEER